MDHFLRLPENLGIGKIGIFERNFMVGRGQIVWSKLQVSASLEDPRKFHLKKSASFQTHRNSTSNYELQKSINKRKWKRNEKYNKFWVIAGQNHQSIPMWSQNKRVLFPAFHFWLRFRVSLFCLESFFFACYGTS